MRPASERTCGRTRRPRWATGGRRAQGRSPRVRSRAAAVAAPRTHGGIDQLPHVAREMAEVWVARRIWLEIAIKVHVLIIDHQDLPPRRHHHHVHEARGRTTYLYTTRDLATTVEW